MVYKHCVNYDGDEDCHKCCAPGHPKYMFDCPAGCEDYKDCFGRGFEEEDGDA